MMQNEIPLPPLPETRYNGCGDGSEPLYTPEMMHDYARAAIAAARPAIWYEGCDTALAHGPAASKPAPAIQAKATDGEDRSKWTLKQWYEHVGAWEDERDCICFGSVMALGAMLTLMAKARAEKSEAFALREWLDKSEWVQKQIATFPISALGKHRADVMREEIERLRSALARHAAALVTVNEVLSKALGLGPDNTLRELLWAVEGRLRKQDSVCDALNAALQQAAGELPELYTIRVEVELDAGWVEWISPDGNATTIDHEESLALDVSHALEDAKEHAAVQQGEKGGK